MRQGEGSTRGAVRVVARVEGDRAVVSVVAKRRVGGRQACGKRTWLSLARCLATLARRS